MKLPLRGYLFHYLVLTCSLVQPHILLPTMSLVELPTELRLHIFSFLPELHYGRHETIGPNVRITPAISRVNRTFRSETLPVYARTSAFIIHVDDNLDPSDNRVQIWLDALGEECLGEVQSLQLSRHWEMPRPSRWHGHVGFYVRLHIHDQKWQCAAGTYPIANDIRGMRLESVDFLQQVVSKRLRQVQARTRKRLSKVDVLFVLETMDIVASHPISSFDTEQSEAGRRRRRDIWSDMETKLSALAKDVEEEGDATKSAFYTPY
jgi:hypothetical protein